MKYGKKNINKFADPRNWELWDAPKRDEVLYQKFPEFTCLCPRSGYPDFATVHMITVPNKKVVELKCLKLWLNSFRSVGISHENMTQKIVDTMKEFLDVKYIFVLMEYSPRGNLTTFPMASWKKKDFVQPLEIDYIKKRLLNKLI